MQNAYKKYVKDMRKACIQGRPVTSGNPALARASWSRRVEDVNRIVLAFSGRGGLACAPLFRCVGSGHK